MADPVRGEIWLVQFDPQRGREIGKTRPALVISASSVGRLPLRIVVPVTDWKPNYAGYPWFAYLAPTKHHGLSKDSGADAFQVKSVSLQRFVKKLGSVGRDILDEVAAAIALCVDYTP